MLGVKTGDCFCLCGQKETKAPNLKLLLDPQEEEFHCVLRAYIFTTF